MTIARRRILSCTRRSSAHRPTSRSRRHFLGRPSGMLPRTCIRCPHRKPSRGPRGTPNRFALCTWESLRPKETREVRGGAPVRRLPWFMVALSKADRLGSRGGRRARSSRIAAPWRGTNRRSRTSRRKEPIRCSQRSCPSWGQGPSHHPSSRKGTATGRCRFRDRCTCTRDPPRRGWTDSGT